MEKPQELGIRDEVEALTAVATILDGVPPDTVRNILTYLNAKFGTSAAQPTSPVSPIPSTPSRQGTWTDFAALYDAAAATSGPQKALVGGYWLQTIAGNDDFDSQSVNSLLKDLGHGSLNITQDFQALIEQTPRLVLQVKKGGKTRQARKRYRLTREGLKTVDDLLSKGGS